MGIFAKAAAQIIEDDDALVFVAKEFIDDVGSEEARAAGY